MIKKTISIFLAVVLLFSCISVIAFADYSGESVSINVSSDKTSVNAGEEFTLTVTFAQAIQKLGNVKMTMDYNETVLEFVSASAGGLMNKAEDILDGGNKYIVFSWDTDGEGIDTTANMVVYSVTFLVKSDAATQSNVAPDLKIDEGDFADATIDQNDIPFTITNASVGVTTPTPSHSHNWSSEWSSDATYHWHKCTGTGTCDAGNVKDKAEHTWTAATCTAPKTCAACGYTEGSALGHNYTEKIEDDAHLKKAATKCTEYNEYWYDCSKCDANAKNDTAATDKYFTSTTAKGNHHFTEKKTTDTYYVAGTGADCQHAKEYYYACADCSAVGTIKWTSTTKGPHSFGTEWDYKDATGHAHKCTVSGCTEHETVVAHTPGAAATETTPQTCTECGYVIAPATGHIRHTLTNHPANPATCTADGNIEYWTCSGCNDKFSDADGTNKITGSVTIAALGHDHSGAWVTTDENEHWKVCAREGCSEQLDKAAHTPSAWVNIDDGHHRQTCTVCEKELTHEACIFGQPLKYNATSHWEECTKCGDKKNEAAHEFLPDSDKCTGCDYTKSSNITIIIPTQPGDSKPAEGNPSTGAVSSPVGYVVIGLAAVGALCFGAKKLTKKHED